MQVGVGMGGGGWGPGISSTHRQGKSGEHLLQLVNIYCKGGGARQQLHPQAE